MEFHNAKLLPRPLPEIMAQVVPYEIYADTKVVVHPRLVWDSGYIRPLGYARYDDLTHSFRIGLYPTKCCHCFTGWYEFSGTYSFQLWITMLHVALHEIGHLATYESWVALSGFWTHWHYIECVADAWMKAAMERILSVDPRLGQPLGALTGYPGVVAHRFRHPGCHSTGANEAVCIARILEWRALGCGGQVTITAIARRFVDTCCRELDWSTRGRIDAVVRRQIHEAAKRLGIERYFVKNGRRYLMFNVGEAQAVWTWLIANERLLLHMAQMQKEPEHRTEEAGPLEG